MRSVRVLAGGLMLTCLVSCGLRRSQVRQAASPVMNCPEESIEVLSVAESEADKFRYEVSGAPRQYIADGCGRQDIYFEACNDEQCYFSSAGKARTGKLHHRAGFDTEGCADLKVTWLDYVTAGVTGCGQRLTYVWSCPHDPIFYSERCSWVLNASSMPMPMPTPPSASPPAAAPTEAAPNPSGNPSGLDKM